MTRLVATAGLLLAALVPLAETAQAQPAGDAVRFGVSVGGISTFGVNVEFFSDSRSIEIGVGTWSFRDLSISAVGKQYVGGGALRAHIGAGLWMVVGAGGDERTGAALMLRAPIGVDWEVTDPHAVGMELNLNRVLLLRRSSPADDRPRNSRLVTPLPGIYYRYER